MVTWQCCVEDRHNCEDSCRVRWSEETKERREESHARCLHTRMPSSQCLHVTAAAAAAVEESELGALLLTNAALEGRVVTRRSSGSCKAAGRLVSPLEEPPTLQAKRLAALAAGDVAA